MTLIRGLARWETLLVVLIIGLLVLGANMSRFFLTPANFSNLSVSLIEVGIMALPMALIVIAAEIDLSVESMVGLSVAVLGFLWAAGVPLWVGIPVVLIVGVLGGALNGALVTWLGLPSLVVTLGTLALFRGLALVVLGQQGVSRFPTEFTTFGFGTIPGTHIPWPLTVFTFIAVLLALLLHAMWPGRQIFAIGKNAETARFSGVHVARTKMSLFILSGLVASLAGVILTARFASARADAGQGMTLTVVTCVLLGGVSIFGGRGTIPGVVLAVVALSMLGNALRLGNVATEIQSIAVGLLLIVSVVIQSGARELERLRERRNARTRTGGRSGSAGVAEGGDPLGTIPAA